MHDEDHKFCIQQKNKNIKTKKLALFDDATACVPIKSRLYLGKYIYASGCIVWKIAFEEE
jgi:hypothetical protein